MVATFVGSAVSIVGWHRIRPLFQPFLQGREPIHATAHLVEYESFRVRKSVLLPRGKALVCRELTDSAWFCANRGPQPTHHIALPALRHRKNSTTTSKPHHGHSPLPIPRYRRARCGQWPLLAVLAMLQKNHCANRRAAASGPSFAALVGSHSVRATDGRDASGGRRTRDIHPSSLLLSTGHTTVETHVDHPMHATEPARHATQCVHFVSGGKGYGC